MEVWNEMVGALVSIDDRVEARAVHFHETEDVFMRYAHVHNNQNPTSAKLLMALMEEMDEARRQFKPFENLWYCAHKGYSLN